MHFEGKIVIKILNNSLYRLVFLFFIDIDVTMNGFI